MIRPLALAAVVFGVLGALAVTLGAPRVARADPDPVRAEYAEYDAVLEAYKAESWDKARTLAVAFGKAHPDFKFAHSALFMGAQAAWNLRRYDDVIADAERYAREFAGRDYADRLAVRRGAALFKLRRGKDAKAALDAFLASNPKSKSAAEAKGWRERIDPVDKTVRGPVVLDYEGKYVGDARFVARVAEVERLVPVAIERIRKRLALPAGPPPRFVVRFRDTGEHNDPLDMETMEELRGDEVVQALVVRTETLVIRHYDIETALTHELLHVWHRSALKDAYYDVPKWAREGLALWVAEQGPGRLAALYNIHAVHPTGPDPVDRLVNGLGGKHTIDDYGEDWLAFAAIEAKSGVEGVRALGRDLLGSADVEKAFAKASGVPFAEFEARARSSARERIAKDLAGRDAYLVDKRLFAAAKWKEAIDAYDALLAASPDQVLAPQARLERAISLYRAGRLADARAAFDALSSSPLAELFHDDVADYRARIAHDAGDPAWKDAVAAFVRDFSWVDPKRLARLRGYLTSAPAAPASPEPPDERPKPDGDD